jgi:hypothetical protein
VPLTAGLNFHFPIKINSPQLRGERWRELIFLLVCSMELLSARILAMEKARKRGVHAGPGWNPLDRSTGLQAYYLLKQ